MCVCFCVFVCVYVCVACIVCMCARVLVRGWVGGWVHLQISLAPAKQKKKLPAPCIVCNPTEHGVMA